MPRLTSLIPLNCLHYAAKAIYEPCDRELRQIKACNKVNIIILITLQTKRTLTESGDMTDMTDISQQTESGDTFEILLEGDSMHHWIKSVFLMVLF